MRSFKTIILPAIVFYFLLLSQNILGQYVWQNPIPNSNFVRGVFVFDSSTAVAVGYPQSFYKSTDMGNTWTVTEFNGG
ncbi:MAG: hypothetical protein ABIY50_13515, partial [Ignavibacteria bacterium]